MTDSAKVGAWGEIHAARFMRDKGYDIISANYHARFGEIDLICSDGKYLIFTEVKSRTQTVYADAMEYVDETKQGKILLTAELFISKSGMELQPRFDVIEVYLDKDKLNEPRRINHIKNAFSF